MINREIVPKFAFRTKVISIMLKGMVVSLSIALISSCGSQDSASTQSVDGNARLALVNQVENDSSTNPKVVPLLESLATLYPNGQIPVAQLIGLPVIKNPIGVLRTSSSESLNESSSVARLSNPQAVSSDFKPVIRIQNTSLYGAYFFTIYDGERASALATNPGWRQEGAAFWASLASGTGLSPVHRFRNQQNGSYLYTIYETERASIAANYSSTFVYEGVAWYAQQTGGDGWSPLYRFRNKTNGTYLFSAYESEKNTIVANYSAIFTLEGIAYYVRQDAPVPGVGGVPYDKSIYQAMCNNVFSTSSGIRVTGGFGYDPSYLADANVIAAKLLWHTGIDCVSDNTSKTFYSAVAGVVLTAGDDDFGSCPSSAGSSKSGVVAIWNETENKTFMYLHGKDFLISKDQKIEAGTALGTQSNTNAISATMGSHTHFEIRNFKTCYAAWATSAEKVQDSGARIDRNLDPAMWLSSKVTTPPPPPPPTAKCTGQWNAGQFNIGQSEQTTQGCSAGYTGNKVLTHTCQAGAAGSAVGVWGATNTQDNCVINTPVTCQGTWNNQRYSVGQVEDTFTNTCPAGTQGQVRTYHTCQASGSWGTSAESNTCTAIPQPEPVVNSVWITNYNVGTQSFYYGIYPYNNTVVIVNGSNLNQNTVVDMVGYNCNIYAPETANNFYKIPYYTTGLYSIQNKYTYPSTTGFANQMAAVCQGNSNPKGS